MKKIISFLDDGFIRLILFILFWITFCIYAYINEKYNMWNFLYYLILYVPLTVLLLKKSFYFANMLLLITSFIEIISSGGMIISCFLNFEPELVINMIFNFYKFIMFLVLFTYILLKMIGKNFNELKNELLAKILLILFVVYMVIIVADLIVIITSSKIDIACEIFRCISSLVFLFFQIVFIITSEKSDKLIIED